MKTFYKSSRFLTNAISLLSILLLTTNTFAKSTNNQPTLVSIFKSSKSQSVCKNDSVLVFVKASNPSDSVFIQSIATGDTIAKSTDSIGVYIKSNQTGAYKLTVSDFSSFDSKTIVITTPTAQISGLDSIVACSYTDTVKLNANGSFGGHLFPNGLYKYTWTSTDPNLNLSGSNSKNINITQNTKSRPFNSKVFLEIEDSVGCKTKDSSIIVWDKFIDLRLTNYLLIFCPGSSASSKAYINGPGKLSNYQWKIITGPAAYTVASDTIITVTGGVNALIEVSASNSKGCRFADTLIAIKTNLVVKLNQSDTIVCKDQFVNFSAQFDSIANATYLYKWKANGVLFSTAKSPKLQIKGDVNIELTVRDQALGCDYVKTTQVKMSVPVAVAGSLSKDTFRICEDIFSTNLNALSSYGGTKINSTTPYLYSWSSAESNLSLTNTSTNTIGITNVNGLNNYTGLVQLKITDKLGCVGIDSAWLEWNNQFRLNIPNDTLLFCVGIQDSIKVLDNNLGTFSNYDWKLLSGTSNFSIKNDTTLLINSASNASFSVIAKDEYNCPSNIDTIFVDDIDINASINPLNPLYCTSDIINLNSKIDTFPSHDYSYLWKLNSINYSTNSDTTHELNSNSQIQLIVKDLTSGCIDSASTAITLSIPTTQAGLTDTIQMCNDIFTTDINSNSSNGTTPYTYAWSSANANIALTNTTTNKVSVENIAKSNNLIAGLKLQITDSIGCIASDSVWLQWNKQKDVVLTSDTLLFCESKSDSVKATLLGIGSFVSYNWNLLSGTATYSLKDDSTLVFTVADSAFIEVIATDAQACIFKDTLMVNDINLNPSIAISKALSCKNDTVSLSANYAAIPAHNYSTQWLVDNVIYSNSKDTVLLANANSSIKAYVRDLTLGCLDSASTAISLSIPTTQAGLTDTIQMCNDIFTTDINSSSSNGTTPYTYAWSSANANIALTNATSDKVSVQNTAKSNNLVAGLKLQITDNIGCIASDSVWLQWNKQKDVVLTHDTLLFCESKSDSVKATLVGTGAFVSYNWNLLSGTATYSVKDDTTLVFTVADSAFIEVIATDAQACIFKDTLMVNDINLNPSIAISKALSCKNDTVSLSANYTALPTHTYSTQWIVDNVAYSNSKDTVLLASANSSIKAYVRDLTLGCLDSASTAITLSIPTTQAGLTDTILMCNDIFTTDINSSSSNGTTPYSYTWSSANTNIALTNTTTNKVSVENTSKSNNLVAGLKLQITDSIGCVASDSVWLQWNKQKDVVLTHDTLLFCESKSDSVKATLVGTGAFVSYNWNLIAGTATYSVKDDTTLVFTVADSAFIEVIATDAQSCIFKDTLMVNDINLNPSIAISKTLSCKDDTVSLSANYTALPAHNYSTQWLVDNVIYSNSKDTVLLASANSSIKAYVRDLTLGCLDSATTAITLSIPTTQAGLTDTIQICNDIFTTDINSSSSNGTTPYAYTWSSANANIALTNATSDKVSIENTAQSNNLIAGLKLQITDSIGCIASDSVWLQWNKQKDVVLTHDTLLFCESKSDSVKATLAGIGSFVSYNWNLIAGTATYSVKDDTTLVFTVADSAFIEVIATDAQSCIFKDTLMVNDINLNPSIAISKTLSCKDDTVSLSANYTALPTHTYSTQWIVDNVAYSNSKDTVLLASANSSIKAYVRDLTLGCLDSASTAITLSIPTTQAGLTDTILMCNDIFTTDINSSSSNGTTPYSYTWSSANTNIALTNTTTNKVSVENTAQSNNLIAGLKLQITDSIGCIASDSVWLQWNKQKDVVLTHDTLLFCESKSDSVKATLAGIGAFSSYNWNLISGTATYSVKDDTTLVFTVADSAFIEVIATDAQSCIFKDTLMVNDINLNPSIAISKTLSCKNDTVSLSANYTALPAHNYSTQWLVDNVIYSNSKDTVLLASANSSIKAYVRDLTLGCLDSASTAITLSIPTTQAGLTDTIQMCNDIFTTDINSSSNNGTTPYSYTWSSANTNITLTNTTTNKVSVQNTSKSNNLVAGLKLQITDSIGCIASDSVWLQWNKQKDVVLTSDTLLFCESKSDSVKATLLGIGAFSSYNWNLLSGTATYSVKDDTTLVFTIADSAFIEVITTDAQSCIFKDTLMVDSGLLDISIQDLKDKACLNDLIDLKADFQTTSLGKYTYTWEINETLFSTAKDTSFTFNSPSKVKVTINNTSYGCSDSDSITILPSTPIAVINPLKDTLTVCFGIDTAGFGAKNSNGGTLPYTYNWTSNDSRINLGTTNADTLTIVKPSSLSNAYSKIVLETTDSIACQAKDSIVIEWQKEILTHVNPSTLACNTIQDTLVSKTAGLTYTWSSNSAISIVGSSTQDTLIYHPNNSIGSININLRVKNADQCIKDTVIVVPMQELSVSINAPVQQLCSNTDITLKAIQTGASTQLLYNWNGTTSVLVDSIKTYRFSNDSTVTVKVLDPNTKCEAQSNKSFVIDELMVKANTSIDSICFQDSIQLKVQTTNGGSGSNVISWLGGELITALVADSVKVQPSTLGLSNLTEYYLKAEDALGCIAFDTVKIARNNELKNNVTSSIQLCKDSTISVGTTGSNASGGSGNYQYLWSSNNGQISNTTAEVIDFTPLNSSTNLSLTVIDAELPKCKTLKNIAIDLEFGPKLTLKSSYSICSKDAITLDADSTNTVGASYLWSTNEATKEIRAFQAGSYSVTATSSFGCKSIASTFLNITIPEKVNLIGNSDSICAYSNKTFVLEGAKNGTIVWSSISAAKDSLVNDSTFIVYPKAIIKDTITVNVSYSSQCADTTITLVFKVNEVPQAQFITSIPEIRQLQNFGFINQTANASSLSFDWKVETDLSTISSSTVNGPELSITNIGFYNAQLVAINSSTGCRDTLTKAFEIIRAENLIYVPSAFYPSAANAENKVVKVYGNNISEKDFTFKIYNRWGELMYQTQSASDAQNIGWNEYSISSDDRSNITVFTYILTGEFIDGTTIQKNGTITLIK